MLIPIPIFIPQYPYVKFKEISIFKGRTVYEKHTMGVKKPNKKQEELIRKNRNLLLEHRVPINKVKFVFAPSFEYDVDKNEVSPVYHVMLPINGNNGLFAKGEPVIEVGKPRNLMLVNVGSYKFDDNYEYLKGLLKTAKRGIAIFIADEEITDLDIPYKFSVDDEVIRLANLDTAVEHYGNVEQEIQTV
jgi:hypothetical protein